MQQVTGDHNVPASKISVKVLLGYPADTPPDDRNTISDLIAVEPLPRRVPLDQIPEQVFTLPADCYVDSQISVPNKCIARLVPCFVQYRSHIVNIKRLIRSCKIYDQ